MTMRTPESSLQFRTERSASFNLAEIKQIARIKSSNTEIFFNADVESLENSTCPKPVVHHVRHASLDSHPSALHPINLNSKFDHLFSLSPPKASAKASIISDDRVDKESSFFSAPLTQRESFSTSVSAESKSLHEHPNFIVWGSASFCLSEVRDLISGSSRSDSQRRSERLSDSSIKNRVSNCNQGRETNDLGGLLSSRDEGLPPSKHLCPSRDGEPLPLESIEPSVHLVASAISTMESSVAAAEDSVTRQSSVGSTISIHDSSTFRHMQAHYLEEFAEVKTLMSSEAQSCCLDYEAHDTETLGSSDTKIPAEEMQGMENTSKHISEEGKIEQETDRYAQEVTRIGHLSSSHLNREVQQECALMAAEEVKIRAELELEIEKELEQEIKTKIYLLNKRLDELTVLKATRHPKLEQREIHTEDTPTNGQEDHVRTVTETKIAVPLPKSPPSSKSSKNKSTLQHSKADKMFVHANKVSSKKQFAAGENDRGAHSSYSNIPLKSSREFTTASGRAPHTKDSSSQLSSPDGSLKNTKLSKHSIDGLSATLKPKVEGESKLSFKQDYQSWTVTASSKRFDWIRTLRADIANTPHISLVKIDGEESSKFLPSKKHTICGNVARTLFTEDSMSTPKKTMSKARGESSSTLLAGNFQRSMCPSAKTHTVHTDMVTVTPPIRSAMQGLLKDNHSSRPASAKSLSQKPPLGGQASRDPSHTTRGSSQAKVATTTRKTTSALLRASPQPCKDSRIEKKGSVGSPASTNHISLMKNVSPTQGEKLKRCEIGLPNFSGHKVSSKETKNVPAKTPSKQVSLQCNSRIAPSRMPVNSTPQLNKISRIGPPTNLAKRQTNTPLKTIGASAREEVASRH